MIAKPSPPFPPGQSLHDHEGSGTRGGTRSFMITRTGGAAGDHGWVPHIALVTVVVGDYDEAIDFYVRVAGFRLVEDTRLDEHKRWARVLRDRRGRRGPLREPPGSHPAELRRGMGPVLVSGAGWGRQLGR